MVINLVGLDVASWSLIVDYVYKTKHITKIKFPFADKLQVKPQNQFEHIVVTNLSVDFKVTDLNMDRLAKLRQELYEKYEQTNNRVCLFVPYLTGSFLLRVSKSC